MPRTFLVRGIDYIVKLIENCLRIAYKLQASGKW